MVKRATSFQTQIGTLFLLVLLATSTKCKVETQQQRQSNHTITRDNTGKDVTPGALNANTATAKAAPGSKRDPRSPQLSYIEALSRAHNFDFNNANLQLSPYSYFSGRVNQLRPPLAGLADAPALFPENDRLLPMRIPHHHHRHRYLPGLLPYEKEGRPSLQSLLGEDTDSNDELGESDKGGYVTDVRVYPKRKHHKHHHRRPHKYDSIPIGDIANTGLALEQEGELQKHLSVPEDELEEYAFEDEGKAQGN